MSKNFQDVRKQTKSLERAGQVEGIAKGKVPKSLYHKEILLKLVFLCIKGKDGNVHKGLES